MYYCLSINKKLLVSRQFSGHYGVTKYGSGWKKDVINKCLEFVYHCISITVTSQLHGCTYQSSVIANTLLLSLSTIAHVHTHTHTHTHAYLSDFVLLFWEPTKQNISQDIWPITVFSPLYMLILTHLASQSPVTAHSFALPCNYHATAG